MEPNSRCNNWIVISGIVQHGHQIASGQTQDSPYPQGSIEMQLPHFQALGLDLSAYFKGTLNVCIRPHKFVIKNPMYLFRGVQWTSIHPPEDFSFASCQVRFNSRTYNGLIYYPHPETKTRHFQDASTLEILAPPIPALRYQDRLEIGVNPQEVLIEEIRKE